MGAVCDHTDEDPLTSWMDGPVHVDLSLGRYQKLLHACRDINGMDLLACRGAGQINSFSYTCCQSMIKPRSWAQGYLRARPRVHAQLPSLMQARLSLCVVVMFKLFGVRELWKGIM
jgi:hypothetical protein